MFSAVVGLRLIFKFTIAQCVTAVDGAASVPFVLVGCLPACKASTVLRLQNLTGWCI
jgi:hypothetical protein